MKWIMIFLVLVFIVTVLGLVLTSNHSKNVVVVEGRVVDVDYRVGFAGSTTTVKLENGSVLCFWGIYTPIELGQIYRFEYIEVGSGTILELREFEKVG